MSKKLLHKTLRVYILFALMVLLLSAPLFYFITDRLFIEEADETLLLHQKEFITNNLPEMHEKDIAFWNKISRNIKIEPPVSSLKKDSIFYRLYLDTLAAENEPYRVLFSPIIIDGKPYTFMARFNLIESEDLIVSMASLFCIVLILLLTGLYFITRRLSFKLWMPFYSTLNQIEQFELNKNINPDFANTDIEEFTRLNQSVGRLLEKNLSVYNDQKEFIENAAHELQTPLAVFQVKLDTLAQQMPFTKELGDTLSRLNEAASGLNRINKNLLLLSKIENSQFTAFENISIGGILAKQAAFLTEQAGVKSIPVHIKYDDAIQVKANTTLLEIAINNLLLNALRHNKPNGQIFVSLLMDRLVVSNTSEQGALSTEKLFKRFSNQGSEGSGLGLSIVKKISDLHGWSLSYNYQDTMHIFQLCFQKF